MNIYSERIDKLREKMREVGADAIIVPTSDAHNSEYVGDHDQIRRWLSGFTGSNGTLVVTKDEALLWTDGRYFIQCAAEIAGSGIQMMKMGEKDVPRISEYIASLMEDREELTLSFDGRVMTAFEINTLVEKVDETKSLKLLYNDDLAGELWLSLDERPKRSCERVKLLDMGFSGLSATDKISQVREAMEAKKCNQLFISKLDDIMWLFNLRGGDVECNPVALSYAFISQDEAFIFLQKDAVSEAVRAYLASQRIIICDYEDVYEFLKDYPYEGKTYADLREISHLAYQCIIDGNGDKDSIVNGMNPTTELKAVKNDTEIKNMREYFLRDSAAMTEYIYWLKKRAKEMASGGEVLTEVEAAAKCDELRKAVEGNLGLSFPTIAAYGSNAAMMHYEATEESYAICKPEGMILTDCGGQYPGATTDVTRTVALGPVSDEEKTNFTLVLKGWLSLMNAQWIDGCTGRNLDILARGPLWAKGIDYKCGTGHGVGCYLNVHEGPQNIRWKYIEGSSEAVLKAGMTVTDEPGVYVDGKYGIRTENTLLVEDRCDTADGHFLGFENLTWVPIDMDLVVTKLLSADEINSLNNYHNEVIKRLGDRVSDEVIQYLQMLII